MNPTQASARIYRVIRAVLFSLIATAAVLYVSLYVLLSVPSFQRIVADRAEKELSPLLGGELRIQKLTVRPFSEVVLHGVSLAGPDGNVCAKIETLGAGIRIWRLVLTGRIEISYAEIIGLDGKITQAQQGGPLNVQFLIDALKPKDTNKPPTRFDLSLHTVVLRRCALSYKREWMPPRSGPGLDLADISLTGLKADLLVPKLKNDSVCVDLRRLAFQIKGGPEIEKIAFKAQYTPTSLSVEGLTVQLPQSEVELSDIRLDYPSPDRIPQVLETESHRIVVNAPRLAPGDFAFLVPELTELPGPFSLFVEAEGDTSRLSVNRLSVASEEGDLQLNLKGEATSMAVPSERSIVVDEFSLTAPHTFTNALARIFNAPRRVSGIAAACGDIKVEAKGRAEEGLKTFDARVKAHTMAGDAEVTAAGRINGPSINVKKLEAQVNELDLGALLGNGLGRLTADITAHGTINGKKTEGEVELNASDFTYKGAEAGGVNAIVSRAGNELSAEISVDNSIAQATVNAEAVLDGTDTSCRGRIDITRFTPSAIGLMPKYPGYNASAAIDAALTGTNADNLRGQIALSNLKFDNGTDRGLWLRSLLVSSRAEDSVRNIRIQSDVLDAGISGKFRIPAVVSYIRNTLAQVLPGIVTPSARPSVTETQLEYSLTVKPDEELLAFFKLPVVPMADIPVYGSVDEVSGISTLSLRAPYLRQGKQKLLRDNALDVTLDSEAGSAKLWLASSFPAKKGDMTLRLNCTGDDGNLFADLNWETPANHQLDGDVSLQARLTKNEFSRTPDIDLEINPSTFDFGNARWQIDRSRVQYADGNLDVDGLRLWHGAQLLSVNGRASALPTDTVTVELAGIDVDYIFDTLNINYVQFGGVATGKVTACGALGPEPVAHTDWLRVDSLTYNGCLLGNADMYSHWDNAEKEVTIAADIHREGGRMSRVDGGIWVTRDSLSFDIDADRVPVSFLAPFMSAFCSGVKGYGSGNAKLAGTFSDIDLTGRLYADSVALKLDYTNVWYHGSDSIYFDPGKIIIPSFRLYDRNGNSALLSGELQHRYFHDPRFDFRVTDARKLLCFDTNQRINPDWYGTFYGNGGAQVKGWPGTVSVSVDMTAVGDSRFTFVLNDTEAAEDFPFLTFSDRRKEEAERLRADTVPDALAQLLRGKAKEADRPSKFMMDIRASVNPSTLMTLVMDPAAGDKIVARGDGNIQMEYDSESNELQMYGKYTLEEGTYNFSLQDLILRDFKIKEGSSVSFNGNPLAALLDITAAYRVNTNLSDLDKSFSNDRELNRTNVPVDAVLMVDGNMNHPDISFDIQLPTLTQDVERKVKSIISTDDMMNRQIIYLLALNRFYTPEYMGSSSNGGELASVASATLSSQLANMLSQLTDKFTLAPSIRSDKGDFSDVEVDVALSSRLLNNRLLVNGNFGYRDKSTSSTTFVGDFDIEYLLNRNGNLRLKAYNHFNDQNYYLRQALTTQGLGVIYRKDFDNPFSFLHRKKKQQEHTDVDTDDRQVDTPLSPQGDGEGVKADDVKNNADR